MITADILLWHMKHEIHMRKYLSEDRRKQLNAYNAAQAKYASKRPLNPKRSWAPISRPSPRPETVCHFETVCHSETVCLPETVCLRDKNELKKMMPLLLEKSRNRKQFTAEKANL
jgi:hypothetical protein